LSDIVLAIASADTEVTVRLRRLRRKLRSEEKQRVFGVFPNFFTSYVHDTAPLAAKQKFSHGT
jgi:hypothetical protein